MIRPAPGNRPGFGLVELMIVIMIIGILARIAVPAYEHVRLRARAAQAIGHINTIRVAAYSYYASVGEWPPDVTRGNVPPELRPFLGQDFTFQREGYLLDWDHWVLPDGTPSRPETGVLVGVSVVAADPALGRAMVGLVGESVARFTINEHHTFIIETN